MTNSNQRTIWSLRFSEILYLVLIASSFYLLLLSRTGEAHTVWEVLHPAFIPILFVAAFLLFAILFTSEKVTYKLVFIICYSFLIHSFFSIIFPAGDLSGQQMVLGRTRLVYDNVVLHGVPSGSPESGTVESVVYDLFRGTNFQAALSVVFARMFSTDIFWIHLFLVPILWGVFVPIVFFLILKTLGGNDKVSVLASLLVAAFPYTIYFGAISVPNSLGFIFFFYSVYFMLKNSESSSSRNQVLMLAFSFFAFLSHFLTGIMSFSLVLLSLAFKSYQSEKSSSLVSKSSLAAVFVLCSSLLPFSLIYLRFFRSGTFTVFTLDKLSELPFEESIKLFLLGQLADASNITTIILVIIGPSVALLYLAYLLFKIRGNFSTQFRVKVLFLFSAFLLMLVDYRILKLFMDGLPLNEERLWVFRDFLAVPFVALAVYGVYSSISAVMEKARSSTISFAGLKALSKVNVVRILGLFFITSILIPIVLGGWITLSLKVAYPQVAPLQTTWYELEAVRYIAQNTHEKYVVIGDIWTIYAGEVVVGINNPSAYYFGERSKTGHDLFVNMTREPSSRWMILAMNYTNTAIAFFIVTEARVGAEDFNNIIAKALQNKQLTVEHVPSGGKLYVFSYGKG